MLGSLFLLWAGLLLLYFLLKTRRPKNFPPGPQPFPIFGNLLQLNLKNPIKDFEKLSKCYGKVYSIYFGGRPAVLLHGLQAVKEALMTRGVEFAGRPQGLLINHATENKGVIIVNYGPTWKEQRRFALTTLRNFGLGKLSMEERILEETSHLSSYIEKSAGQSLDPKMLFHNAFSNVICAILFGSRYKYEDQSFQSLMRMISENTKINNGRWGMIYDTIPLIRSLPLPFRKMIENRKKVKAFLLTKVAEHKETRVPGQPRDILDCYLDEIEKRGNDGSSFDDGFMVALMMDLFFAGTDTSSTTLRVGLLQLMLHPDVQARCHQEIDAVLGEREQVCYEDRHRMPYVQAVIHEVQRYGSVVPLSVFHATTQDTQVLGYSIPKGTTIIPNLSSVLYEEGKWKFPHEFNPSNFLKEEGEFVKPEAFVPFSLGPRMCLGEGLARMGLFLFLVMLLRRFQFHWPQDGGEPDLTPKFGITQEPKPYRLGVKLRGQQSG
ncbi:cytochrome P450 2C55 isoform X1 [Amia ocellicauda]|uniref:cytochrome P450 2C55 isoform X1 n=2 Tax=Amia ocellicauda TaxID=2972642 RepID=UPI0034646071